MDKETRKEKARIYHKKRREQRKAAGICVLCGYRKARPNRTTCTHCAQARSIYDIMHPQFNTPEKQEKRKAYQKEYQKKIKLERQQRGQCMRCGGVLDDPKYKTCSACREQRREWEAQRRKMLKER